jgi:mono/diheme cytochrome c family protein
MWLVAGRIPGFPKEETMFGFLRVLGLSLVVSAGAWWLQQAATQEKPKEAAAPEPAAEKKNPVKSTPEVLAASKKIFGYDCAMCHGATGDGKGEMVESMQLTMLDLRDPAALSNVSDGEIYDLIVKGKGKMVGEGDRLPPAKVWGLVHYVRTLAKKKESASSN